MIEGFNLVILTLMNWIHLFATVTWFGAISTMFFILVPSARGALEPPVMGRFMGVVTKRMKVVVYISAALLIVTGIVLLIMNPPEAGYSLKERWGMVLFVKHILVVVMLCIGLYVTEGINPKIDKLIAAGPSPELGKLQKKQLGLGAFNFILSLIILLLSGYMFFLPR